MLSFYDRKKLLYADRVGTGLNKLTAFELWSGLQSQRVKTSPLSASGRKATPGSDMGQTQNRCADRVSFMDRGWPHT